MSLWQNFKKNWKANNSVRSDMTEHWKAPKPVAAREIKTFPVQSITIQAIPNQQVKIDPVPPFEKDYGPSRKEIDRAIRGLQKVASELT